MSELTDIRKAIAKLTADEIRQLTIWLLTDFPPLNNSNLDKPNPFSGTLIVGTTRTGKSGATKKLSGK